jgi:peptidoglycan hydrolase CwlO-like protein
MRTYYIQDGKDISGPFGLEELIAKKITKKTLIWFQGRDEWSYAETIDELQNIFVELPPPLENITSMPKMRRKTIMGLEKSYFFSALGIVLLIIGTLIFNTYQENRSLDFEQKNRQTEFNNLQMEQQQKEADEQKMQAIIQEQIDAEKSARERKDSLNNRILEIKKILTLTTEHLENDKIKLADAKDFKLLRTTSEREEEISLIQNDIDHWQDEIRKLENEANRLYLELETIH